MNDAKTVAVLSLISNCGILRHLGILFVITAMIQSVMTTICQNSTHMLYFTKSPIIRGYYDRPILGCNRCNNLDSTRMVYGCCSVPVVASKRRL